MTISTPGGTSATSAADEFTFKVLPTVSDITPDAGSIAGGTVVTITAATSPSAPPR